MTRGKGSHVYNSHQNSGNLTLKGFDALIDNYEHISKQPDPVPGRVRLSEHLPLALLQDARDKRLTFEQEREERRSAHDRAEREKRQAQAESYKQQKLSKLRAVMAEQIDLVDWSDEDILEFVDRIAAI